MTQTQSICGHHNFRQWRERLSLFDFWLHRDYFSRSLTSRSGSRDTNIQESDDWQRSSVRFSIACKKGCSEFFIKRSVFEESSKCPLPTNKHPEPEHSTFSCWWIVECFIEPVSWCNLVVHTWSEISIFPLGKANKVLHDLRISEGLCKQLQRTAQSTTTLSLGGLIQPLLVKRQP